MSDPRAVDVAPAILKAGRAMAAATIRLLAERGFDGLTPGIVAIIAMIDLEGDRATALAQKAGVTKQAMSQLLRLLIERDYVEQVADPSDTRAKVIRCTRRGATLRAACFAVRDELHTLVVRELGAKNADRLQADLDRLQLAFSGDRPSAPKRGRPKRKAR